MQENLQAVPRCHREDGICAPAFFAAEARAAYRTRVRRVRGYQADELLHADQVDEHRLWPLPRLSQCSSA